MILDLRSVDKKGKKFHWDESSPELKGALEDLVGSSDFQIQIQIQPLGHTPDNTYQIKGYLSTHYPEKCSRCGYDIDLNLNQPIHEIIFIEKKRTGKIQVSQSPKDLTQDSPSITYIETPFIDLKELMHELVATAHPPFPQCSDLKLCESRKHSENMNNGTPNLGHPGFAILKSLPTKQTP